jgi:hypothetical protein
VECGPCISFGVDQCLPDCNKLIHFLPLLLCSYLDDRCAHVLELEALKKWSKAAPNAPLPEGLQEENREMKGPRESIEHSYGQVVTQLWNLAMTGVKLFKLDLDPEHVFAQIRMMHFFTSCRTCLRGSVVSSRASLDLYPPILLPPLKKSILCLSPLWFEVNLM